jgi:hypothetical protein
LYQGVVAQPGRCVHCKKFVTLHIRTSAESATLRCIAWFCPVCGGSNHVEIAGHLALVSLERPDPDSD